MIHLTHHHLLPHRSNSGAWVLSLTWILLMRCISGVMVWLSVLAVISILAIVLSLSATRLYYLTHPASQAGQVNIKHQT